MDIEIIIKNKAGSLLMLTQDETKELYKQLVELYGENKTVLNSYPIFDCGEIYIDSTNTYSLELNTGAK